MARFAGDWRLAAMPPRRSDLSGVGVDNVGMKLPVHFFGGRRRIEGVN